MLLVTLVCLVIIGVWVGLPGLNDLLIRPRTVVDDALQRKGFPRALTEKVFKPEQLVCVNVGRCPEVPLHRLTKQPLAAGVEAVNDRCRVNSVAPASAPKHGV